jgi:hypothetical protein
MRKTTKIAIIVFAVAAIAGLVIWDAPRNRVELLLERDAIEQAVKAYFKAEMEQNFKLVYTYLAPSSVYRKKHSYQDFLNDVGNSPVRIKSYRIVDIYRLRNNDNRETYPFVDKFVQVEVDVDIGYSNTGVNSTYNYCFTFLKEYGVWYKG